MNKRTRKVFEMLKPKVKALGFSRKELESVAEDLSDNLDLDEEASEEDEKAEIEKSVNAVVPFLKLSQKAASRAIDNYKKQLEDKDDDNDDDDDDDTLDDDTKQKGGKSGKKSKDADNETAKLFEKMMSRFDSMEEKISAMEKGKTKDTRRAKLEEMLKDTGSFGKRTLRNFDKMSFDNDDDFDEFIDEVKTDLKEINEERTQKGLEALGKPAVPPKGGGKGNNKEDVMSDDDIDAMASSFM